MLSGRASFEQQMEVALALSAAEYAAVESWPENLRQTVRRQPESVPRASLSRQLSHEQRCMECGRGGSTSGTTSCSPIDGLLRCGACEEGFASAFCQPAPPPPAAAAGTDAIRECSTGTTPGVSRSDVVDKLLALKDMLQRGIIDRSRFDATKVRILAGEDFTDTAPVDRPATVTKPGQRAAGIADNTTTHCFVDASNLFIGARSQGRHGEVHIPALAALLLKRGGQRGKVAVGGSRPAAHHPVWDEFEREGFEVHLQQRAGNEEFVDDMLHAQMLREIVQRRDPSAGAQIMILVSGDGNGNDGRCSFPECVERAVEHGWQVEVWAWQDSLSSNFSRLRDRLRNPNALSINLLDNHRDSIIKQRHQPRLGDGARQAAQPRHPIQANVGTPSHGTANAAGQAFFTHAGGTPASVSALAKHRHWSGKIILNSDGTFRVSKKHKKKGAKDEIGQWLFTLPTNATACTLTLAWENWPSEQLRQCPSNQLKFAHEDYRFELDFAALQGDWQTQGPTSSRAEARRTPPAHHRVPASEAVEAVAGHDSSRGIVDELLALSEQLQNGELTREEFERRKCRVVG